MKDRGWILPDVVDPPDSYTVCICIPNEIHYIAAFWGALQELGYQHNWQRDEAHTALPVSVKWNEIIADANERSNGMPLMCFTCEELEACITPLLEAQSAEFAKMLALNKYGSDVVPGTPMTEEEREADLAEGTNPTCNLDIVCGQAGNLTLYWIDTVLDILEKAEAATNTAEFLDVVTQITGLDEASADVLTGYITFLQESINEGYSAAVTLTYQDEVTCAIYCKAKGTCTITPQMLYDVFKERIEATLGSPLPAFASLIDLFQFFYGVPMDSTLIPDVMHLIIAGGGILAQTFMGDVGVKPLQVLMGMWADEPSNDCSFLCECPEEATEPIIDPAPCGDPDVSDGTNIEHLGGTRYRVTSTANVFDAGVAIKDINGAAFQVDNVTFPDMPNVFGLWLPTGGVCTTGATPPELTSVLTMVWTWNAANVGARVEFDFLPV